MRLRLFGKEKRAAAATDAAARLKLKVREQLALPETAAIAVNEILCADPACPGTETVILVMKPGEKTRAYKIQAALDEVDDEALRAALAAAAPRIP
jgi:hypothetical protein